MQELYPIKPRMPRRPVEPNAIRLATLTYGSCESIVQNLLTIEGVSVSDQVFENLVQFYYDELFIVSKLNSDKQLSEHYDACKKRYELLYQTIVEILDLVSDPEFVSISLVRSNRLRKVYHIGTDTMIHTEFTFADSTEKLIKSVNPRSYKQLYKALGHFIQEHQNDSRGFLLEGIRQLSLVILSIGKVYDDLRGDDKFIKSQEEEAYVRLSHPDMVLSDELKYLFDQVVDDIYDNPKLPYIRDISRELKYANYLESAFDPDRDYFTSTKSTGTKVNGEILNGLFASIIEVDSLKDECFLFDQLVGYQSYYLDSNDHLEGFNVQQRNRVTRSIEQHKLKRRIIHLCSNPIQDRANWYHNRISRFLRNIPTDCTFNQEVGVAYALRATSKVITEQNKWNIYCLDLSNATDTLSRHYQQMCIDILMPNLGKFWTQIVCGDHMFLRHKAKPIVLSQKRGQPQGYKSSFPAFAWAHHIVMRMVMKFNHLEHVSADQFYRVLGDDSIITTPDPTGQILTSYMWICDLVGWECHDNKGYKYYHDRDSHASAEFAKTRVMDGRVFTPIPLQLALKCNNPKVAMAAYLFNIKRQASDPDIEIFFHNIQIMGYSLTDLKREAINYLAYYKLGDFKYLEQFDFEPDLDRSKLILLAYFITKIKGTLLEQWLPSDYIGNVPLDENLRDPFLGEWNEEILLSNIDISDNHKYWRLIYRNERLIEILDSIFGKATFHKSVVALELTEQDRDKIYQACEILQDWFNQNSEIWDHSKVIEIVLSANEVLDHYNPRSESRKDMRDIDFLDILEKEIVDVEFASF